MSAPIKFGTDGWRGVIARDYTFDNLSRVADAMAEWVKTQAGADRPQVMIGYDTRFQGTAFTEHVANRLAHHGVKVFLSPGFVSTPMVSLATLQRQCHAGVVITASHNPPSYNGFKVKGHFGGPAFPSMIADLEQRIPDQAPELENNMEEWEDSRQVEYYDMEALYLNHVKQAIDLKAIHESGLKIGYDAMYGAGQRAFTKLFPQAQVLHCVPNPGFMGQAPEPIERNLSQLQHLVREHNLDFGLANDGDADRIGLFNEKGEFVDSHHIILLLIHYLAGIKKQKAKVIVTFSCTDKIRKLCEHYGLPLEVTKIGFKYIGELMQQEDVLVGGEESGGIAVKGHVPERDGIFIGLVILEMMAATGKSLTQLVEDVYALTGSFSVQRNDLHLPEEQKQAVMKQCREGGFKAFGAYTVQEVQDKDGFKFLFEGGEWVLIRPSGTEPVLRIYAEGADRKAADAILAAVVQTIVPA